MAAITLQSLLKTMLDKGASDLHVTAGSAPRLRIDGELVRLQTDALSAVDTKQLCYSVMNDADHRRLTGTCMADLITGVCTAMGILAALLGRERSAERRGMLMETSLLEAMSTLTIDALTQAFETGEDPVRNSRHPQAQNFCLETADGGSITLHLSSSQKFWAALARAIEREDLITDPRFSTYDARREPAHYEEIVRTMQDAFAQRTRSDWEQRLLEADVPFAPVLTMHEVASHEQTRWLALYGQKVGGIPMVCPPWRFDGMRPQRSTHAAHVGEHTHEVLGGIRSESQLQALAADGTIAQAAAGAQKQRA